MMDMGKRGNLEGTKLADGRWQIRVTVTTIDGRKLRKAVYGATKAEAQRKAHELIHEERSQVGNGATIKELAEAFMGHHAKGLSPSTLRSYKAQTERIVQAFGNIEADRLTTPQIINWLNKLNHGGRSVDMTRTVLGTMLNYGKQIGANRENPLAGLRIKKKAKPIQRRITEEQLESILKHMTPQYAVFFRFLADTGLRPWKEGIKVTRLQIGRTHDEFYVSVLDSKSDAGIRVVPIRDRAVIDHILTMDADQPLFPHGQSYRNNWERAREKAEIDADVYSLRRFAITRWCAEKPLDEVMALAGHSDLSLTLKVYNEVQRNRIFGVHGIKDGIKVSEITGE